MQRSGLAIADSTVKANSALSDLSDVIREATITGQQEYFYNKVYKLRMNTSGSAATQFVMSGMPRYIVEAALLVGVAAFILVQALTGDIVSSAATVGVFLSGGFRLTAAMLPLQSALLNIKGSLPLARKAHEILSEVDCVSADAAVHNLATDQLNRDLASEPLRVQFTEVSFAYPNSSQAALQNVSLAIDAGDQVAFIGPSGAGKSTLADLMCGVLEPTTGTILDNPVDRLPASVSYVPQRPGLVSGTLAQNVALGLVGEEVDEARVWDALERAHLREVVLALPQGIHTDLGNYQDGLSGGQIQRLGLARALYTSPGLLVMDEATSALDAESEAEIAKALDQIRGKVTVVLIAHRLNTVQHADKVFLINEGRLTDQGTFLDLLKRNPTLDRLVQLMKVEEN
jgi:ATP-binding cassette subfamily C protein